MILISLMLGMTPPPIVRPDDGYGRRVVRPNASARVIRSKRLIELEALVKSLPAAAAEPSQGAGPQGL
jgi:hypothetical protein